MEKYVEKASYQHIVDWLRVVTVEASKLVLRVYWPVTMSSCSVKLNGLVPFQSCRKQGCFAGENLQGVSDK